MEREAASFHEQLRTFQSIIVPLKRRQVCTIRYDVASQNIRIFSNLTSCLNATNATKHKPGQPLPPPSTHLMASFHKHCGRSLHVAFPLLHILPISRSFYNTVNYGWHKTLSNYGRTAAVIPSGIPASLNKPYITAQWQTLVLSADGAAVAPATTLPAPTILIWLHSLTGMKT